jgi:hypothetical protein
MGEKEPSHEADWRAILERLRAEGKAPPRPIADDDTAEIRESAEDGVLRRGRLPREAELTLEQLAPVNPQYSQGRLRGIVVAVWWTTLTALVLGAVTWWLVWGIFLGGWSGGPCDKISDPVEKADCEYWQEKDLQQDFYYPR